MPIKDNASAAASTGRFGNDLIRPPCDVVHGMRQLQSEQTLFQRRQSNTLEISSLLRDGDFDMSLETRTLTHALVPSLEIFQVRSLNREGVPSVDQGPERDLGKSQLIAGEIILLGERIISPSARSAV